MKFGTYVVLLHKNSENFTRNTERYHFTKHILVQKYIDLKGDPNLHIQCRIQLKSAFNEQSLV